MTYGISQLTKRAQGSMALDLTDLMTKDNFSDEEYFGDMAKAYYVDGKPYALPTKLDKYGIVINADMFEEAGIEIPTEWTYDEFREIAKKLTHGEGPVSYTHLCLLRYHEMGDSASLPCRHGKLESV